MIDYIRTRGTQPFKYHLDLEIINEKTPETWSRAPVLARAARATRRRRRKRAWATMDRDTYILITPVRDEEATIGVRSSPS